MENETKPKAQDDGAGEKLVDEKNGHHSKGIEVKYLTPTSQNGDAKIDIENLKSAFAGMGKEELMKFANDPFWIRTRWFLFILFWVLWAAMLAGAIAIIVLAPKCAPPVPRDWWEKSPLYKVNIESFSSESGKPGDLKGLTSKLDYFKELGVKSIVLPNILKVSDKKSNFDGKDEFTSIASSYGTLEDFKQLISSAKERGLKLLLTLIPNHSSMKNEHFTNPTDSTYYVWAGTFQNQEPTNWKSASMNDTSAWKWDESRQKFYLHQFDEDEPDFDFRNPAVLTYFDEIFKFWLDLGVSGFYLERTPYLLEDKDLKNETLARATEAKGVHTGYEFHKHTNTKNLPELTALLAKWKDLVAKNSAILVIDNPMDANRSAAHLSVYPKMFESAAEFPVLDLHSTINTTLKKDNWPVWEIQSPLGWQSVRLTSMLLPGVPVTHAFDEIGHAETSTGVAGQIDAALCNSTDSLCAVYKALVKERESTSVQHGELTFAVMKNSSVIAYTRIKKGTPGLAVVFNTGPEETIVDLKLPNVPQELTKVLRSDPPEVFTDRKDNINREEVQLKGFSMAVFRFVPQSDEN